MKPLRWFGAICTVCKRFAPLGKIDADANTPASVLRARLTAMNWKGDSLDCENPDCLSKTQVDFNKIILGDPV